MAIVNRDLDASQTKEVFYFSHATLSTGATRWIGLVPYPCTVQSMRATGVGVSNLQIALQAQRFAGGNTVIALGISNLALANFGTSGAPGYSGLAAAGSTVLNLQAGDILMIETSVANAIATSVILEVVVKKTQDIVSHNGISS